MASGAASAVWAEGVRAGVAAGSRWFPGRAAMGIGSQGPQSARGWRVVATVNSAQGVYFVRVGDGTAIVI